MTLTTKSAVEFPLATLCDIINRAFKGYVGGEINFSPPTLAGFMTHGDIHLTRSLVVLSDGAPAGIALLARRGWSTRVGLMGIISDYQNQGVGRWLLGQIAHEARNNGIRTVLLEVIEQNPRAVHLYEACGYRPMRRLLGYDYKASTTTETKAASTPLEQVDIAEAAHHIAAWETADLPWECSGMTLAKGGAPGVAYRVNDCYAICSNPDGETIVIAGLAVPPDQQRKGLATQLVATLMAAHPDKNWHVSPIWPEEFGPIFERNGFTLNTLNQFQMRLDL